MYTITKKEAIELTKKLLSSRTKWDYIVFTRINDNEFEYTPEIGQVYPDNINKNEGVIIRDCDLDEEAEDFDEECENRFEKMLNEINYKNN
jgi:hypothetical protein